MNGNFKPTVTLADLYESQNQILDAYAIYRFLDEQLPEGQLRGKINSLEKKIFEEFNQEYDPVIKKIFSKDEIEKFKILPTKQFSQYQKMEANLRDETKLNDSQKKNDKYDKIENTDEILKFFQLIKGMDISEIKDLYETHLKKIRTFEEIKLSQINKAIKFYKNANSPENQ